MPQTTTINVRKMAASDYEEAERLFIQLNHELHVYCPAVYEFLDFIYHREAFNAIVDDENEDGEIALIAEDRVTHRAIGACLVKIDPDFPEVEPVAEITSFVVDKDFRRQGVARALYRKVIACCRELDVQTLFLTVCNTNTAAIKFYLSQGLTVEKTENDNIVKMEDNDLYE